MIKRIKRIFAKVFRCIWIISVPGVLYVIVNCFFLGNPYPTFGITEPFSFDKLLETYAFISIIAFPVFIISAYVIMRSIYREHWKDAYKKQLSGKYRKDPNLWNDKDWYK